MLVIFASVVATVGTQRIAELCAPLLPAHASASIKVERLRVGNSNVLHSLTRTSGDEVVDRFLVREFGALALDRDTENAVFAQLSEFGIAPPLVATFDGGRIEGWLDGGPCTPAQCSTPEIFEPVARELAALHAVPIGSILPSWTGADDSEDWSWATAAIWLEAAQACADKLERLATKGNAAASEALIARVRAIDLNLGEVQMRALRSHIDAHPALSHRCFCHNDLSNTNVHHDARRGATRILDFEFGGVNTRGFDLATHLSHWAGGATDGRYDDAAFPSMATRTAFLRAYLRAASAATPLQPPPLSPEAEQRAIASLHAEVSVALPLAHWVWGLWALNAQPDAVAAGGNGPFSHIEYAERRLAASLAALPAALATTPAPRLSARSKAPKPVASSARPVSDLFRPDGFGGSGSATEGTRW